MTRMGSVLDRQKMQLLESVETDPADVLSTTILAGEPASLSSLLARAHTTLTHLTDAIFGKDDASELGPSMKTMSHYHLLEKWTSDDWAKLLEKSVR